VRVLHAIHDFLPRHAAGSEIYAHDLCRALMARGHEVHVLCAEYDPSRPHGSLEWRFLDHLPVTELINNWHVSSFTESYRSAHLTGQIEHVLRAVQPDVVHVHNLLNLSFDLPAVARSRGMPSVATVHEYVLLCPSGGQRVHLAEEHVCHDIDPDRCARCFVQSPFHSQMVLGRVSRAVSPSLVGRAATVLRRRFPGLVARAGRAAAGRAPRPEVTVDDVRQRLAAAREVFETVELWVAPSPALGAELTRFGLPASRLEVSDYGFVPFERAPRRPRGERLRIGFVGTLVWHKGAHVLIEAVRQLDPGSIEVHLHGSLDTFPDYAARLQTAARGLPVHFAGGFDRTAVAGVYAGFDVVAICSLWPENSPLVIHEAFMAGLPVVGSRMGGIVDLVDDDVNGLLYDAFAADDLAIALRRLVDEPELLERLAAAVPGVKSIDEDAAEWEDRYARVLRQA
jgi:glycosyltransferase involved in cell wall biosynthesis